MKLVTIFQKTMSPSVNSCSIVYIFFAWLILMCSSFVILSSAAGGENNVNLFTPGESLHYQLRSTVLVNDKDAHSKNVGFYIEGEVLVKTIWGHSAGDRILKIELRSPQLHIRSRKSPTPDGFIPHTSQLESYHNQPFLVVWRQGKVDKVLLPKNEPVSLSNLKKAIASFTQLQLLDIEQRETDVSGQCDVTYRSLAPLKIVKTKTNCISPDLPYIDNADVILGTSVTSSRTVEYELDAANNCIKTVRSKEVHHMYMAAKEDIGGYVEAEQSLTLLQTDKTDIFQGDNIETVLGDISKSEKVLYTQETLLTETEIVEEAESFVKTVDELREVLATELLGTLKPAKAFLRLVVVARNAQKDDIAKTLSSKKNKMILLQLYDVLGYAQTLESHQAVVKKLHFDKDEELDFVERYLWALSFSSQPNLLIIEDLLQKFNNHKNIPEKLRETLILTIASMTFRLQRSPNANPAAAKLVRKVEETIINELDYSKNDDRHVFFRALKNLKSKSSVDKLLDVIKNSDSSKEGVLAWKALKAFDPKHWNGDVLKAAEKTFFQLDKKHDSSARTLAADILLDSTKDSGETLRHLVEFLATNETVYEIKQYVYQRIKMIADEDEQFKNRVLAYIKSDKFLNNYSTLSPRGVSIALKRNFLHNNSSRGSLLSVQEMNSGIAKRGIVNVVMEKHDEVSELFSLGIFSGGLSSFVSSNTEQDAEEEATTAGMELTVLGTQIRPFVFFNGQGELMGHVWSGTASEKTAAFQALVMLQDHLQYLRLGSGFIVELDLKGAMSFDLSGQIEISIWNRNAKSLVEKSAGIRSVGSMKIDTTFVRTQLEFSATIEPKLHLQTDVYFASNTNLCMRLTQPDSLFRHNVFKIERIPGSKHKLRIARYKKYTIPGTTYSLNRKNNEMCSAIFSENVES